MENYEKKYVAMRLHVDAAGTVRPIAVEWDDGQLFEVQKVLSAAMSPPPHVGAMLTMRYDCVVEGSERALFHETQTNRWFVERLI